MSDWADRIVQRVKKNVRQGVEDYSDKYLDSLKTGNPVLMTEPSSRIAIITVLESVLEEFPELFAGGSVLEHDYNEDFREVIKQIKERGNLK